MKWKSYSLHFSGTAVLVKYRRVTLRYAYSEYGPGLFSAGCVIRRVGLRRVQPCHRTSDQVVSLTQP